MSTNEHTLYEQWDSLILAMTSEADTAIKDSTNKRIQRQNNTVQFVVNKTRTKAIKVVRQSQTIVERANSVPDNVGYTFTDIYVIVYKYHSERVNKDTNDIEKYVANKVIAVVGYETSKGYMLLSNGSLMAKLRGNGEDMEKRLQASATIEKCIMLSAKRGSYDSQFMMYHEEMKPATQAETKAYDALTREHMSKLGETSETKAS